MKFVIWAPPFSDTSGGVIALHLLCHRLNEMGETALLWPSGKPAFNRRFIPRDLLRAGRWALGGPRRAWRVSSPFENPIARPSDLRGAVIVYPEMIDGNPLGEPHVVRWLLHKPGHHTGRINFSSRELVFSYLEAFDDLSGEGAKAQRLTLTWLNSAYGLRNNGERTGSAYLMRKGKSRPLVHDLNGSIRVDDLSHAEKARVFNEAEFFYSYDLYTLYNLYALICGCIPVVIPEPGVAKEDWLPEEHDRYGIAYGFEDVDWAISTRPKMLERLAMIRRGEDEMLHEFVRTCRREFSA